MKNIRGQLERKIWLKKNTWNTTIWLFLTISSFILNAICALGKETSKYSNQMIDIYILTHTLQTKDFCCNVTFFFFF